MCNKTPLATFHQVLEKDFLQETIFLIFFFPYFTLGNFVLRPAVSHVHRSGLGMVPLACFRVLGLEITTLWFLQTV